MNTAVRKGLIVAAVHLAMVGSLGAKLLIDRQTRPRVWARTLPFDPDSPLRGRYVRLRVEGEAAGIDPARPRSPVSLVAREQSLAFEPVPAFHGLSATATRRDGEQVATLDQPVAFFIPEHVPDPSVRAHGEELWVEVTVPRRGGPRPIRLAVKKDGVLTPLDLD